MIRLAAVVAFSSRPVVLRALFSRLLTPLLTPFGSQAAYIIPEIGSTPLSPSYPLGESKQQPASSQAGHAAPVTLQHFAPVPPFPALRHALSPVIRTRGSSSLASLSHVRRNVSSCGYL